MDFERWAKILAKVESHDNPHAWGDEGLAVGRWQMHPAFYHDFASLDIPVDASWDTAFRACLRNFFSLHSADEPLHAAMMFHLGVHAVLYERKWDDAYALRWHEAELATP